VIDENAYADSELASLKNLVAAVFRIEHPTSPKAMQELLTSIADWLSDRPDLRRMFGLWVRATLMRRPEYSILLPQVHDLQELNVMLSDKLEEWALAYEAEGKAKGKAEGVQEGLAKGEMLSLQKLLTKRFGSIPSDITAKISAATLQDIERWFDRAIDASQLADVFDG